MTRFNPNKQTYIGEAYYTEVIGEVWEGSEPLGALEIGDSKLDQPFVAHRKTQSVVRRSAAIRLIESKMVALPIFTVLLRSPGNIATVVYWAGQEPPFALWFLWALFDPLMGALNFVLFVALERRE